MITIDYLITTFNKTNEELIEIINRSNVFGHILVGNQGMKEDSIKHVEFDGKVITIFNQKSVGVSKNRNFLLKKAESEYVTFLDDDMYYADNVQNEIEEILPKYRLNCVRFNVLSDNNSRPIKQLKKCGFVGFRKLSSFGAWGCFFRREFLLENKIFYNESIGPGTEINHGEDGVFLKTFLLYSKIFFIPKVSFHVSQKESTWHNENRDLKTELFSHGFNYYLLYGKKAKLMAVLFLISHMHCYPPKTKFKTLKSFMIAGINNAKEQVQ